MGDFINDLLKKETGVEPFKLPVGFNGNNNGKIKELFELASRKKAIIKDVEAQLEVAKKEFSNIEDLLIDELKTTGGEKIEFEKGFWVKMVKKIYYSFRKDEKQSMFDWLEQEGMDDIISVNANSLGGALRSRFKEENEEETAMLERLPEFITHYDKDSISLSTKAVNRFREGN